MQKDEDCVTLLFKLVLIGGVLRMFWGLVGSMFTVISVFITIYLKFSYVFELCNSRKFKLMHRFGDKSEKIIGIGRNIDSISIIVNTYIDFSYLTAVFTFTSVLSILDELVGCFIVCSVGYFVCTILLVKDVSQWLRKTNPKFEGDNFEFKAPLIAVSIIIISMIYVKDFVLLTVLIIVCLVLYCVPLFYYGALLRSQDVKVWSYISFGTYDNVQTNRLKIVLQDGRVFDNKKQQFYPLFQADGTLLLYTKKRKEPETIEKERILRILYNNEEIKV